MRRKIKLYSQNSHKQPIMYDFVNKIHSFLINLSTSGFAIIMLFLRNIFGKRVRVDCIYLFKKNNNTHFVKY